MGKNKEETTNEEHSEIGASDEYKETADSNLKAVIDEAGESEGDLTDLEEELEKKAAQYEDIFSQFQRLQADFANYKKRIEKEKSEIFLYANKEIGLDLLEIMDNLERAIHSQSEAENVDNSDYLLDGVNLVYKQLIDVLNKHGIEEIEALGKPFDMNFHHAVMQEETEGKPNYVIDVLQKGYKINDRVLRPSMVKVSK